MSIGHLFLHETEGEARGPARVNNNGVATDLSTTGHSELDTVSYLLHGQGLCPGQQGLELDRNGKG